MHDGRYDTSHAGSLAAAILNLSQSLIFVITILLSEGTHPATVRPAHFHSCMLASQVYNISSMSQGHDGCLVVSLYLIPCYDIKPINLRLVGTELTSWEPTHNNKN